MMSYKNEKDNEKCCGLLFSNSEFCVMSCLFCYRTQSCLFCYRTQ